MSSSTPPMKQRGGSSSSPTSPERSTKLIIVTGFLTETMRASSVLKGSALEHLDFTAALDSRAWMSAARCVVHDQVEISDHPWASQSLFHMISEVLKPLRALIASRRLKTATKDPLGALLGGRVDYQLVSAALKVRGVWREAIAQSEPAALELSARLAELIDEIDEESDEEVYILGHSLGGRVAIKALTHLIETRGVEATRRIKVSVWAPAIARREVNWELLALAHHPPELIISRSDLVLRVLFPIGQLQPRDLNPLTLFRMSGEMGRDSGEGESWFPRAVGFHGPPASWLEAKSSVKRSVIDVSDHQITHLGYLPALEYLMKRSEYLAHLIK